MKGWRTLLVNTGLIALAAALQYLAGVDFTELGVSAGLATIIVGGINLFLRLITTTSVGRRE